MSRRITCRRQYWRGNDGIAREMRRLTRGIFSIIGLWHMWNGMSIVTRTSWTDGIPSGWKSIRSRRRLSRSLGPLHSRFSFIDSTQHMWCSGVIRRHCWGCSMHWRRMPGIGRRIMSHFIGRGSNESRMRRIIIRGSVNSLSSW